jgi:hypothetical protein
MALRMSVRHAHAEREKCGLRTHKALRQRRRAQVGQASDTAFVLKRLGVGYGLVASAA